MSLQPNATPVFTSVVTDPTAGVTPSFVPGSTETSGVAPVFTGYSGSVGYTPGGTYRSKSNVNAGAIAGGVVGGLAVVAIAVVLLYWIRRRYPKVRHVETEAVSAPPHYVMPVPNVSEVTQPANMSTWEQPANMSTWEQPAHASTGEQPAYVYKSEGLGAREEREPATEDKHSKGWPVDKKM